MGVASKQPRLGFNALALVIVALGALAVLFAVGFAVGPIGRALGLKPGWAAGEHSPIGGVLGLGLVNASLYFYRVLARRLDRSMDGAEDLPRK